MPISGAKYRFKKTKDGKSTRLAFKNDKVVEATLFKKNKEGVLKKAGKSHEVKSKISSLASRVFKS